MPSEGSKQPKDHNLRVQQAISALENKEFNSIREAARFFQVTPSTMSRRLRGSVSQAQRQETHQHLTNAEENTLIRWIKQCSKGGLHITQPELINLAEHIRSARVTHASNRSPSVPKLLKFNRKWLVRFRDRHPEIASAFIPQLQRARKDGAAYEHVKRWFDAVAALMEGYEYELKDIWNMDESGFGIGEQQAVKVLYTIDQYQEYMVTGGKQEWVTDIECISAAGEALAPLLIFRGADMNTRWINERSPEGWFFATSKNGWTSNELGLKWLQEVFDPQTCDTAAGRRRLLIADGHGSHLRADFIAHCMENNIDLLIMPPHCSHILQPLDVGVFSALKRRATIETREISRLSPQRIPRSEWIELLSKAREKAITKENIQSGWRATGLSPLTPMRVLRGIPQPSPEPAIRISHAGDTTNLDLSLLKSSPPEPVELNRANKRFIETLRECPDVVSPVKRYAERMTRLCESQNATIAILSKEVAQQAELLRKRKKARKGKRVRLEGVHVYTTEDILRVAREEEAKAAIKRPRGRPKKVIIIETSDEEEDEVSESSETEYYRSPVIYGRCAVASHVEI
jgi:hypothetical protein